MTTGATTIVSRTDGGMDSSLPFRRAGEWDTLSNLCHLGEYTKYCFVVANEAPLSISRWRSQAGQNISFMYACPHCLKSFMLCIHGGEELTADQLRILSVSRSLLWPRGFTKLYLTKQQSKWCPATPKPEHRSNAVVLWLSWRPYENTEAGFIAA